MDAAHELGHLILHSRLNDRTSRIEEDEAMRFASAFLMPEGSVLARVRRGASMNEIIAAKQYWVVSLAALTYRMRKVGMLTGWEYQTRFKEIGRHNYREQEPESAPRERSEVLSKVFQLLAEDGTPRESSRGDAVDIPKRTQQATFWVRCLTNPLAILTREED